MIAKKRTKQVAETDRALPIVPLRSDMRDGAKELLAQPRLRYAPEFADKVEAFAWRVLEAYGIRQADHPWPKKINLAACARKGRVRWDIVIASELRADANRLREAHAAGNRSAIERYSVKIGDTLRRIEIASLMPDVDLGRKHGQALAKARSRRWPAKVDRDRRDARIRDEYERIKERHPDWSHSEVVRRTIKNLGIDVSSNTVSRAVGRIKK